jgi:type IV pilus assembly protein PilX
MNARHRSGGTVPGPTRSRGAVLVVGLIFLAMLTLMGVAAYSVATQEERMTGNSRDRLRAFEAAEAALRECEAQVKNAATVYSSTGGTDSTGTTGGFYNRMPPTQLSYADPGYQALPAGTNWWNAPPSVVKPRVVVGTIGGVAQEPVCVAEAFDVDTGVLTSGGKPLKTVPMARVTAHGWGSNATTQVTLQSTYLR